VEVFEVLLGLLVVCVALALVARRPNVPLAVVLVLGAMTLVLIPGLPAIELDPQLALVLFLPPLLQARAYRTDWPAFQFNLRPTLLLALGAVLFPELAVAATAKFLVPEPPWAAAIAPDAIGALPDAAAETSILKNFLISTPLVMVLEGESLLNDASSLIQYRFAVAATLAGEVSLGEAPLSFLISSAGGAVLGYLVGRSAGIADAEIVQSLVRDEPHPARADGVDAGVQQRQVQALQIGNIAGQAERDDPAFAVCGHPVGAGKAARDQVGEDRPGARCPGPLDNKELHRQGFESVALVLGKRDEALQLANERN
jgi:CPA1 family monovalent cation:H+ antiporter